MNLHERARLAYNDWKACEESNLIATADVKLAAVIEVELDQLDDCITRVDLLTSPQKVLYEVDDIPFEVAVDERTTTRGEKESNAGMTVTETIVTVKVQRRQMWMEVDSLKDVGAVFRADELPTPDDGEQIRPITDPDTYPHTN